MFTVVIMTNETAAASRDYRRLFFNEAKTKNQVAFCIWKPDGDSVETALPDLYQLIAGKSEWRAIIVQSERDRDEEHYPTQENNPFDFVENRDNATSDVGASRIPLVYLTQLLGGVPEPEVEYEYVEYQDTGGVWDEDDPEERQACTRLRRRYEPQKEAYQRAMHQHEKVINSARYRFVETRPTELLLVSTRQVVDSTGKEIETAWHTTQESNSSEFWHRNFYPSICRFMTYSTLDEVHSLYPAYLFHLWTIILILATNRIAPSSLQAYRLYRVDVKLDPVRLGREFSRFYDRLMDMNEQMDAEERNYVSVSAEVEKKAPTIGRRVEVSFNVDNSNSLFVPTEPIRYTSDVPMSERDYWREGYWSTTGALRKLYRAPRRWLDVAAEDTRILSVFDSREIQILNRYQRGDLDADLEERYMEALEIQSTIGMDLKNWDDQRLVINQQVNTRITQRLTSKKWKLGLGIGLGGLAAGLLPYLIYAGLKSVGNLLWALLITLVCLGVALGIAGIELLIQRKEMQDTIGDYNRLMGSILQEVRQSAEKFSDFLSAVCSYMRGRSYLDQEDRLRSGRYDGNLQRRIHRKAIHKYSVTLESWAKALGVRLSPEGIGLGRYTFDVGQLPEENDAYSMDTISLHCAVALNGSGDPMDSPCDFVTDLVLLREELYEQNENREPATAEPLTQQLAEDEEEDWLDDADFD